MTSRSQATDTASEKHAAAVVTKALIRAADLLQVSGADLAKIIGVSEACISRLRGGSRHVSKGKETEFALLFLRMFRSLDSLAGPSVENMRHWFNAMNDHLSGIPREKVQSTEGLVDVVRYLDAMRGKL